MLVVLLARLTGQQMAWLIVFGGTELLDIVGNKDGTAEARWYSVVLSLCPQVTQTLPSAQ